MYTECETCVNKCIKFTDKCLLKVDSTVLGLKWETVNQTYEKD